MPRGLFQGSDGPTGATRVVVGPSWPRSRRNPPRGHDANNRRLFSPRDHASTFDWHLPGRKHDGDRTRENNGTPRLCSQFLCLERTPWAPTSSRSIAHPRRERRCAAALRIAVQARRGRETASADAREAREGGTRGMRVDPLARFPRSLVCTDPSCDADEHRRGTAQGGAAEVGSLAMMGYRDIESSRRVGFVPAFPRRPERARRMPDGRGRRPRTPRGAARQRSVTASR